MTTLALNAVPVLLTAKGREIDRQKGDEPAADVYMTKSFDPDALPAHAGLVLGCRTMLIRLHRAHAQFGRRNVA